MSDQGLESEYVFRLRIRHKQWIGKADPSGFGVSYFYSNDTERIKNEQIRRRGWGDRAVVQHWDGKKWEKGWK